MGEIPIVKQDRLIPGSILMQGLKTLTYAELF
jgi:hypothetical protein